MEGWILKVLIISGVIYLFEKERPKSWIEWVVGIIGVAIGITIVDWITGKKIGSW